MGDMLSNAVSGLQAFQTALSTIGNNIANASTPGYSRENVNLAESATVGSRSGFVGSGVSVLGITRSYDQFLAGETRAATSSYNQLNAVSGLASTINNMLGDPTTGLSAQMTALSGALQNLANSPTSSSVRQSVLTQTQSLIAQFQSYQSTLNQLDTQASGSINAEVGTINSLAQQIATLNSQIVNQQNETGQPPNQLLDQRDQAINQLAQHVNVMTVSQSGGAVNVFVGSGQPLVVDGSANSLSVGIDSYNSGAPQVLLDGSSGSVNVTGAVTGGVLGGDLQFLSQMLTPAQNTLGQAAVTLSTLLNQQNAQGLDANGNFGGALLAVGGPVVHGSANNTGSANVSASIVNLSALTTSNYQLRYDGTQWTLLDTGSGTSTTLSATTSGTTTTLTGAGGLSLTVTGTAQAGDSFLVQPTVAAVPNLRLLTTDPSRIAAAGPLVIGAAAGNTGSAGISSATVANQTTWSANRGNYTLAYSTASGWSVTNAGGTAVAATTSSSGSTTTISFDGLQVAVTGTPASGDSFSVNDNINGVGDNSNALKLAAVTTQPVLDGGKQSVSDALTAYIGTVGLQTSQAQNGATAQQSLMQNAQNAQQNVSGVNLDEEASNMVRYEQAYQAAAQVIGTSKTLFDGLLSSIRGY